MDQFLQNLPGLGIGGALAVMLFYFYRQDRRESTERYAKLAQDFKTVIQENTAAIQGNTDIIREVKNTGICPLGSE